MPKPKHSNTVLAAADTPSAEPITIDRLIGSIDVKSDVVVPTLEVIEASHEQEDSIAEPPSGEAAAATTAIDRDIESLDGLCNTLFDSAQHNDLPVPFFANLIWQESRLRHNAVSPVGAQGIAQFMPRVAAAVGLADPFDPRQALPASARLLHELRERFRNLGFAAAAYNAGVHRVSEWLLHGGKLPRETQTYVVRITGRSVDEWRKSPRGDSALRFARPLPCRELPAFASLEEEQAQQEQQVQQAALEEPQPQLHAAVAEPTPVVRRRFAVRPHLHMTVRAEAVRKFTGVMHAGMRAGWAVPAQAIPTLAANIPTGGRETRRIIIRPQLMNKVAGYFHGGGGEARSHQQRVPHESRRIALHIARHGS